VTRTDNLAAKHLVLREVRGWRVFGNPVDMRRAILGRGYVTNVFPSPRSGGLMNYSFRCVCCSRCEKGLETTQL